jgi:hypothetical protein
MELNYDIVNMKDGENIFLGYPIGISFVGDYTDSDGYTIYKKVMALTCEYNHKKTHWAIPFELLNSYQFQEVYKAFEFGLFEITETGCDWPVSKLDITKVGDSYNISSNYSFSSPLGWPYQTRDRDQAAWDRAHKNKTT